MSLELNKNIYLGNKIQINNTSTENISSNEKYILDGIEDGIITDLNETEFTTKVKEDAIRNGLLTDAKIEWKKFTIFFKFYLSFMFIMNVICIPLFIDLFINPANLTRWKIFMLILAISLILYLPFSICMYFTTYMLKIKNNNYVRTKKGEELNEKLEGLKNYLKDYSNIHEKDENSLTLWEDYLIYSVIFNQNTKVTKNLWNKYIHTYLKC